MQIYIAFHIYIFSVYYYIRTLVPQNLSHAHSTQFVYTVPLWNRCTEHSCMPSYLQHKCWQQYLLLSANDVYHFKPNPIPAPNNIIYIHMQISYFTCTFFLVYHYQELDRDNRYLSYAHSILICLHCLFVLYIYTHPSCMPTYLHHIGADSSVPCYMLC